LCDSPFFYCFAWGINVELGMPFDPEPYFISNGIVEITFALYIGTIFVIPFLSPAGYLDGIAFIGNIREI
jgi:hypothetical protein